MFIGSVNHEGSIWMGDVAEYMDENFIKAAFSAMDEQVHSVKYVLNKMTGHNAGYCFVHFKDKETATRVLHKLNGKMIPNSRPPTRFMLNESNAGKTGQEREFSIWVGNLEKSVDDSQLYQAFASRYSSVRAARVVTDRTSGVSRGYAFVRFGDQGEQKDALMHMNGFNGLGDKPIRVSLAVPRKLTASTDSGTGQAANAGQDGDYSAYYDQYWYNYQAWQNYAPYDGSAGYQAQGYQGYDPAAAAAAAAVAAPAPAPAQAAVGVAPVPVPAPVIPSAVAPAVAVAAAAVAPTPAAVPPTAMTADVEARDDDNQVVEHDVPADLEGQNQEFVRRNEEFWDALDASRWLQPDSLNPALELFIKT